MYGVMLAVAFILGSWWAVKAAARRGVAEDRMMSLVAWILISSIVGARLHFILGHPESYENLSDLLRVWEGGLTLYGGLVLAIAVSFHYLRRHGIGFLPVADATAPSLALGEAITRIGCFLNGCCFGRPGEHFFCVHYPGDSYAAYALGDVAVYPSQLFLMVGMGLLFLILWGLDRRQLVSGVLFSCYLIGQGVIRFVVDFTRYYEPVDQIRTLGPWIEAKSQIVALALVLVGIVLLALRVRSAGPSRETQGS
jgi:phosphatidylglycerol:prolipoprotein diacylglycerol transferase